MGGVEKIKDDQMTYRFSTRRSVLKASALVGAAQFIPRLSGFAQARRDVSWLAEIQEPPAKLPADAPQLCDLLIDDSGRRITDLDGWKSKRQSLRRWWLDFLGPMPAERKAAPRLTVIEEDRPDGVVRQLVHYEVEPGI